MGGNSSSTKDSVEDIEQSQEASPASPASPRDSRTAAEKVKLGVHVVGGVVTHSSEVQVPRPQVLVEEQTKQQLAAKPNENTDEITKRFLQATEEDDFNTSQPLSNSNVEEDMDKVLANISPRYFQPPAQPTPAQDIVDDDGFDFRKHQEQQRALHSQKEKELELKRQQMFAELDDDKEDNMNKKIALTQEQVEFEKLQQKFRQVNAGAVTTSAPEVQGSTEVKPEADNIDDEDEALMQELMGDLDI